MPRRRQCIGGCCGVHSMGHGKVVVRLIKQGGCGQGDGCRQGSICRVVDCINVMGSICEQIGPIGNARVVEHVGEDGSFRVVSDEEVCGGEDCGL